MGTQTDVRSLTTAAELAVFPDDSFQYELDDGELIMMPLDGEEHGRIEADIVGLLYAEVKKRRLGRLYSSDTGFVLREDPILFVVRTFLSFAKRGFRCPLPLGALSVARPIWQWRSGRLLSHPTTSAGRHSNISTTAPTLCG